MTENLSLEKRNLRSWRAQQLKAAYTFAVHDPNINSNSLGTIAFLKISQPICIISSSINKNRCTVHYYAHGSENLILYL